MGAIASVFFEIIKILFYDFEYFFINDLIARFRVVHGDYATILGNAIDKTLRNAGVVGLVSGTNKICCPSMCLSSCTDCERSHAKKSKYNCTIVTRPNCTHVLYPTCPDSVSG